MGTTPDQQADQQAVTDAFRGADAKPVTPDLESPAVKAAAAIQKAVEDNAKP